MDFMKLLERMFGKSKPEPKIKSAGKTKAKMKAKAKARTVTGANNDTPAVEPASAAPAPQIDYNTQQLIQTLEARKSVDPLILVKACATEVLNRLILAMRDKRGVQAESMLCALGALGGFACQMAARGKGAPLEAREAGGKTYYFGPGINKPLAESPTSILALAKGAANAMGVMETPDIQDIFKHAIDTMGTNRFGIPRVPEKNRPRDLPENYARALWPVLIPTIKLFCKDPAEWPIVFGYAIQQVMKESEKVLNPGFAVKLVMEAAVPASKIDPGPEALDSIA